MSFKRCSGSSGTSFRASVASYACGLLWSGCTPRLLVCLAHHFTSRGYSSALVVHPARPAAAKTRGPPPPACSMPCTGSSLLRVDTRGAAGSLQSADDCYNVDQC